MLEDLQNVKMWNIVVKRKILTLYFVFNNISTSSIVESTFIHIEPFDSRIRSSDIPFSASQAFTESIVSFAGANVSATWQISLYAVNTKNSGNWDVIIISQTWRRWLWCIDPLTLISRGQGENPILPAQGSSVFHNSSWSGLRRPSRNRDPFRDFVGLGRSIEG